MSETSSRHRVLPATLTLLCAASLVCTGSAFAAQDSTEPAEAPEKVAKFYFVPMKGQMGTDVHPSIYEAVIKDIKAKQPDVVVFTIDCADYNTIFYLRDDDPRQASINRITEYRDLAMKLKDELREFKQVAWVEDAVGFSALMALAWDEMYMTSDARLQGLERVLEPVLRWSDPDVRAKMLAAWTGIAQGFFEIGGRPQQLGEAMMRPERLLSVSFEGRDIVWHSDTSGHWVLDGSDKFTARFNAQLAEDIGLSAGIADSREDLAFLLGYREWEEIPNSTKIVDDYVEQWRAMNKQCSTWMLEFQDAMRYATGNDTVKYLGQAVDRLNKVIAGMTKYPAIEVFWQMTRGLNRERLKLEVEKIQEQIRSLRRNPNAGGGGGGAVGGGGLGGSGGRGPRR